jgi:Uncharacterized conserved protein
MDREVVITVTVGKIAPGPWEQIFYGEFDGRRPKRRSSSKIIGESFHRPPGSPKRRAVGLEK